MNVGSLVRLKGLEFLGSFRVNGVEETTLGRVIFLDDARGAGFLPGELTEEDGNPWQEVRGEWERFIAEVSAEGGGVMGDMKRGERELSAHARPSATVQNLERIRP